MTKKKGQRKNKKIRNVSQKEHQELIDSLWESRDNLIENERKKQITDKLVNSGISRKNIKFLENENLDHEFLKKKYDVDTIYDSAKKSGRQLILVRDSK